ncbi:alpha-L-rhamnosidase [Rhizohabitans arisaemae]|uniref:alpha-L-rhamnosidase n=1 Tax=Rhizohabitans arisaemae TaxID=2720610 RepID=UPI0024B1998C|nr:alpha-L-rhamnosidase [Rhizohabitans arisaemae]
MSLTPYHLRTELRRTPIGLPVAEPRFTWRLRGDTRQTGYTLTLTRDGSTVWETGGLDELSVTYSGEPLAAGERYHWRLVVHGADGTHGQDETWFETGPAEWQARWIERPERPPQVTVDPAQIWRTLNTLFLQPVLQFRRVFTAPEGADRARLFITAKGLYRAYVNGVRVGEEELAPGWTEYRHRLQYQGYDVTGLLRPGENVVAVEVADGWWCGYVGLDRRRGAQHYGMRPELLAQLELVAGGERTVIGTDSSWTEHPGRTQYADLLMGQWDDARLATSGWTEPGFEDTGWLPAVETGAELGPLVAAYDDGVRAVAELPARRVWAHGAGYLADLGQNMAGRVRLRVRGARRTDAIQLRHAEILDADGSPYLDNLRDAECTDTYVASGEGEEVFEPAFTMHGFRYVYITGLRQAPEPEDVVGVVLSSMTEPTGSVQTSDPLVNQLQSNIEWSQRGNFVSIPTDCPQRDERLGWLGDAQVFAATAARNADVQPLFTRWLADLADSQAPDGDVPDVIPLISASPHGAPAYGDAAVIVPWEMYRAYGDVTLLRRAFPSMCAWVDLIAGLNPDGIWRNRRGNDYGDWLAVGEETSRELVATAYLARTSGLLVQAAEVLGDEKAVVKYADLSVLVRRAFAAEYLGSDGRLTGDTQTAYLLALAWRLTPDGDRERLAAHLVRRLEENGMRPATGFIGVNLLCPTLTEIGRSDLAYRLLLSTEFPSWGYSIGHGATTIWERWDGWTPEKGFQVPLMNSFNHYSLGSVGEWLYRSVAGIGQSAGSAGYREIVIEPQIAGPLEWVRAEHESPRGRIAVSWHKDGDTVRVELTVPPGPAALLLLPGRSPERVEPGTHQRVTKFQEKRP